MITMQNILEEVMKKTQYAFMHGASNRFFCATIVKFLEHTNILMRAN